MNIAIMVDTLAVGGAERQAILCVSELRKLGHSADLIHYHPKVEYGQMLEHLRVKPIYVPGTSFSQRCRRLRSLFVEHNYDVVHGFKMAGEVYAAVAGTWAGVPRRFGSFQSIYDLSFRYCLLHYLVDKFLDGWIVNSKAGAESMAQHTRISPRKILVLHNGLCTEMFSTPLCREEAKARLQIPEDSIVVTMIARLEPGKNHQMLIDVANQVIRQAPKTYFMAVGKGSLKTSLQDYSSAQGLPGKVLFLGQRPDIAEILAATDISVLTTDFEGLPNAIIESMGAGKPIVCTSYAGCGEIMTHGETALISPCGDANAFAENVLRLIRDQSLRNQLACAGRQYAQKYFSAQTMAKNLEAIYYLRFKGNRSEAHNNCRD